MPTANTKSDLQARTITMEAEFAAPIDRVFDIYADAGKLEKVWGSPGYPATFVRHEMAPGGEMHYYMTGPSGDRYYGYWKITAVDRPTSFSFEDGFANSDFSRNHEITKCQQLRTSTPSKKEMESRGSPA